MGCSLSKKHNTVDLNTLQKFGGPSSVPPERLSVLLPKTGPLPETNYWSRLSLSSQPHEVHLHRSKFVIKYAFTSLRGFYPDALQKSNQDEVCANQLFSDDSEQLLFAVFDGHGSEGHLCAQYAKNKVGSGSEPGLASLCTLAAAPGCVRSPIFPACIWLHSSKFASALAAASLGRVCQDSLHHVLPLTGSVAADCALSLHLHVLQLPDNLMSDKAFKLDPVKGFHTALPLLNKQLHSSRIDDSMSGTTAICGLIRGRSLYIANVGDSRAILAVQEKDCISARALSRDQTPFR